MAGQGMASRGIEHPGAEYCDSAEGGSPDTGGGPSTIMHGLVPAGYPVCTWSEGRLYTGSSGLVPRGLLTMFFGLDLAPSMSAGEYRLGRLRYIWEDLGRVFGSSKALVRPSPLSPRLVKRYRGGGWAFSMPEVEVRRSVPVNRLCNVPPGWTDPWGYGGMGAIASSPDFCSERGVICVAAGVRQEETR